MISEECFGFNMDSEAIIWFELAHKIPPNSEASGSIRECDPDLDPGLVHVLHRSGRLQGHAGASSVARLYGSRATKVRGIGLNSASSMLGEKQIGRGNPTGRPGRVSAGFGLPGVEDGSMEACKCSFDSSLRLQEYLGCLLLHAVVTKDIRTNNDKHI